MHASLVIRNGQIVDGTGEASRVGDVAIADGKIIAVGEFSGSYDREIDAAGKVVAPGFIDIHTHFDPQLCWDGLATPSLEHGVTTVVIGNCSLSLAPVRPGKQQKLVSMFQVIEDIKQATFDAAVPFAWESFPEYLDHIRGTLGVNVGALIGHSALRYYVMGDASQQRTANPEEVAQMCELVEEAMAAGALGISSSYVDMDENMEPVPSRYADVDEKIALCKAMAKSGRGMWQVVPYFIDMKEQLANIRELGDLSLAAGIPCSIQPVLSTPASPRASEILEALQTERDRGGRVYGQVMPRCFDLNMRLSQTSMLLFGLPKWKAIMDMPLAERREKFSDATLREGLVEEMGKAEGMSSVIPFLTVGEVKSDSNKPYQGRYLAEIAESEGKQIGDVILDLANADELDTEFQLKNVINADQPRVAELIDNPLCHFGASDAGAHITQFCGSGDTTYMLEHYVRETGQIPLERAVHRMTNEVARDWGINDRGKLAPGMAADVVIFDIDTVAISEEYFANDFPGESSRYLRKAVGFDVVIVNGEPVLEAGAYTDARPGKIV